MKMQAFFGAIDDTLFPYLYLSAFEHSLLMNILFQDQVLMDETPLWNSRLLELHIKRAQKDKGRTGLFQGAAAEGIILPFSLDGRLESMEGSHERLTQRYGNGYPFALIDPSVQDLVSRALNEGLRATQRSEFLCPANMSFSVAYLELLRSKLQQTDPPKGNSKTLSDADLNTAIVWPATAKWRFEVIEEAAMVTARKGQKGLSRADLYDTLGWELGLPKDKKGTTVTDLLDQVPESHKPVERHALYAFLRWCTQIHHLTRSTVTGIDANLPVYEISEDSFIDSLPAEDGHSRSIKIDLHLPPNEWLFTEGVRHILEIRRNHGGEMLESLRKYSHESSPDNYDHVIENVKTYEWLIGSYCPVPPVSTTEICLHTVRIVGGIAKILSKGSSSPDILSIPGSGAFLGNAGELNALTPIPQAIISLRKWYKKRAESKRQLFSHELTIPPPS